MEYVEVLPTDELPLHLLLTADPSLERLKSYLPSSRIFLLKERTATLGVLCLQPQTADHAEIKNIAIAENCQNRGLGTRLINYALVAAKKQGAKTVSVKTGNSSIHALAFYQKLGFRIVALEPDYFREHYPDQEIIENGIPCKDRLCLELQINE